MKITDIAEGRRRILEFARPALVSQGIRSHQSPGSNQSYYGGDFYGKPTESWPAFGARPLIPWLYLATASLPWVPDPLRDITALAFYIDAELYTRNYNAEEGSQLVVREYRLGDKLSPLPRPAALEGHPLHLLEWQEVSDYPSMSHFYEDFSDDVYRYFCDNKESENLANHGGIKLRGWPTLVQRRYRSFDLDRFILQIDMTENYMYADSGIVYVFLNENGRWYFEFESC